MSIVSSHYVPPPLLTNGHLQTVFPTLFRPTPEVSYIRERIETPDGDFLNLDWATPHQGIQRAAVGVRQAVILSHGLEGSSDGKYIRGMARAALDAGWDALAWNYRGCGGEMNRLPRFYHSGATEDLLTVIQHAATRYDRLALIGFSLGGNLTLKYLGETGDAVHPKISSAVAFSVPCDLAASADQLSKPANLIYTQRFLRSLMPKIRAKKLERLCNDPLLTLRAFDDRYTAPLHGFKDADEYYRKCSCKQFLAPITVPTLIVSAKNDPFLTPSCFPVEEAVANPNLTLEMPDSGGHIGFVRFEEVYWSEARAMAFLNGER